MESKDQRRKRRLKQLAEQKGGVRAVAAAADLGWQALDQVLKGTLLPEKKDKTAARSPRSLGDASAEAIEDAFDLGRGWFDWPFDLVDHRRYWALDEKERGSVEGAMIREIERLEKVRSAAAVIDGIARKPTAPRQQDKRATGLP